MQTLLALFLIMVALATICCERLPWVSRAGEAIGVADPPLPPPVTIDVLCDSSPGSICAEKTLTATFEAILPEVARRPGSRLRLWILGESLETTRIVATATSTPPLRPAKAVVDAHVARFLHETMPRLLAALNPMLGHHQRTSPIAEGVTRIAIESTAANVERHIIVLTDAREESNLPDGGPRLDFECGALPTPSLFERRLHRAGLLLPDSLRGVRVTFCFVRPDAIEGGRCSVSLAKYEQLVSLWRTALKSSGAGVEILTDKPELIAEGEQK